MLIAGIIRISFFYKKSNKIKFTIFHKILFKGICRWLFLIKYWARKEISQAHTSFLNPKIQPGSINLSIGNSTSRTIKDKNISLQKYNNYLKNLPNNYIGIWTDSSVFKTSTSAGCGIYINFNNIIELKIQFKVRGNITYGEINAIVASLLIIDCFHTNLPIFIFTDSENSFNSAFQKINKTTLYPTLKQFLRKRVLLTQTYLIKISSHYNIANNELADNLAKHANNLCNSLNFDSLIELQQSIQ